MDLTARAHPGAGADSPGPRRLRKKILLLAVLPLLASLLLIALAVRHQALELAMRERALVESAYMASKEAELRGYVDLALSMVRPIYDSGRDDPAAKQEAARILASLSSGAGDGYFFAYDFDGLCIVLPHSPNWSAPTSGTCATATAARWCRR